VSEWIEFRSTAGFVLAHPEGWRSAEGVMGAAVVLLAGEPGTGGFAANVSVTAQELPARVEPDEFGWWLLADDGGEARPTTATELFRRLCALLPQDAELG
jgi:hypothetical protein